MSVRNEVRLWVAQRATAAVLAFCIVAHLATIIYAVRGGLTAAEILGRTRGNVALALFYAVFVLSASIHAGIGLRNVAAEWLGWRGVPARFAVLFFSLLLAILGLRAVWAVYA